jgi:hypothetical protein
VRHDVSRETKRSLRIILWMSIAQIALNLIVLWALM